MADLLEKASSWLDGQRAKFMARAVVYRRADQSVEVAATIGNTLFEIDNGYGVLERFESRDFLISAAALTLGLPLPGDTIRETQAGLVYVYEVMAPGKEPCWRYSDPYRQTIRVHSKQVAVE